MTILMNRTNSATLCICFHEPFKLVFRCYKAENSEIARQKSKSVVFREIKLKTAQFSCEQTKTEACFL